MSGDGTRDRPFGAIADAMAASRAGDVIALARGRFTAPLIVDRSVEIVGACTRETVLAPVSDQVTITADDVTIRDLSIVPRNEGIRVHGGRRARIERVIVEDARGAGIYVVDAEATLRDVVVRDTRLLDTGRFGRGLTLETAAVVDAERVALVRNHDVGAFSGDEGTRLTLRDCAVIDTQSIATGEGGRALSARNGAFLRAERCLLARPHDAGLAVQSARVELRDVVLRGVLPTVADQPTQGIGAIAGSSLVSRRLVLDDVAGLGITGTASQLDLEDTIVHRTVSSPVNQGRAISVQGGSTLRIARAAAVTCQEFGLIALDADTMIDVSDLLVEDILPVPATLGYGRGVEIEQGARATLHRVAIRRVAEAAFLAAGAGSVAEVEDLTIEDVRSSGTISAHGRGVVVQLDATVRLTRAHVARAREIALFTAIGRLEARDIVVDDTQPNECGSDLCPSSPYGIGLGVYLGGAADLERFGIERSPLCGVHLDEGELDLRDGTIARNVVGACVQLAGFDLDRISETVSYVDNGQSLSSTTLPVPDSLESLEP